MADFLRYSLLKLIEYFFHNFNYKSMEFEATSLVTGTWGKGVKSLGLANFGNRVDVLINSLFVARGQNLNFFLLRP